MEFTPGDEVNIEIGRFTDIGIRVYIEEDFEGMLYRNEVFRKIREGQRLKAYVKKVREDGLIDVSLQPVGFRNAVETHKEKIMSKLEEEGGFVALTDKSSPDTIKYQLQMSKKAFKQALGALYKERKIIIEDNGFKKSK